MNQQFRPPRKAPDHETNSNYEVVLTNQKVTGEAVSNRTTNVSQNEVSKTNVSPSMPVRPPADPNIRNVQPSYPVQSNQPTKPKSPGVETKTELEEGEEGFAKLSENDIQIILRFLSDIQEGEKLMLGDDKKSIMVDNRYIQPIRRAFTKDSRERTLQFVNHVIESAQDYCQTLIGKILLEKNEQNKQINMKKLLANQGYLRNSVTGLKRLQETYKEDKQNRATVETYIENIRVFCDQDLERVIKNTIS